MATQLEIGDKELLNVLQSSFPLTEEPYAAIGARLGVPESVVIERIRLLRRQNYIREISAIFDTRRLGYQSSLVAMRVPQETLYQAAARINELPGVSHNYSREGYFNLWFTVAVSPDCSLEKVVSHLSQEAGAESTRLLPALRVFKIGVSFDMLQGEGASSEVLGRSAAGGETAVPLSGLDKEIVRQLQQDLPLCQSPFEEMARRVGFGQRDLLERAQGLQASGVMRRYGAVLHHRRAGFRANGMSVWQVPQERIEEVGTVLAAHPAVSHCYQRPTFPDWPYSLFAMVHATTTEGCEEIIRELSLSAGVPDYGVLYSRIEFKKTRVRYFLE
ncbi:MAG: Lrp/AsnC family transcriptional regulator [Chloroflexi bacterium]|nr:Lrp/AsnC family transcriptional regulator [Chloroflexota bacterium]